MALAEIQIEEHEGNAPLSRDQLIHQHLPDVKRIVYRIAAHLPASIEVDDLINAGIIGLIEAVEKFDPSRDNGFMTYAMFRIKGAVLSELRSRDFLSRSTRRKLRELEDAHDRLEKKLGREVKDKEVSEELGLELDEYYKIKKMSGICFISLDDFRYPTKEEKGNFISQFSNNDDEDAYTLTGMKEVQAGIARAISALPEKEKMVISLYYWDELTMKEIGKVLDITESRVSQIHAEAVTRLRARMRREKLIAN